MGRPFKLTDHQMHEAVGGAIVAMKGSPTSPATNVSAAVGRGTLWRRMEGTVRVVHDRRSRRADALIVTQPDTGKSVHWVLDENPKLGFRGRPAVPEGQPRWRGRTRQADN
jgi:hypothetical protein